MSLNNVPQNQKQKCNQKVYQNQKYKVRFGRRQCIRSGVIIECDNKYLFVFGNEHRKWRFPKGHIEAGETWEECAVRELREETGITIDTLQDAIMEHIDDCAYYKVHVKTLLKTQINDIDEVSKVAWMTLADVSKHQTNSHIKRFIRMNTNVRSTEATISRLKYQLTMLTRVVQELTDIVNTL